MNIDQIHTLLAALDDYEQAMWDCWEMSREAKYLVEFNRAGKLYALLDAQRKLVA
ncbi:hypothetical protein AU152_gp65 [Mycobacterium phage Phlei]|uniref:Uncharacterized protein n=1 Tax=Mycobacterium phage Phlei TaxID=1690684 RepID=A0A0N7E4J4_9CAUD|nr:hypothetical protein AU152_gp65 [Mycobacterium phage Phlei]ALA48178.1 hypothetical protein [Mycobacterium phage Phlei]